MRFIQSWSYKCADYLAVQLKENHEKRRVYYFGMQVVIGEVVKAVLLILISWILGLLKPVAVCAIVFAVIRTSAGGYHMNTHGKCFITSIVMFIGAAAIVQYTYSFWSTIGAILFIAITFIVTLATFIKWAPADTPNKPITKPEEIRRFKRKSIIYSIILPIISIVLWFKGFHIYSLAATFGILLESFTVTPAGYRFFEWISGKAGHK